jgi:hypothetical protein
MKNLSSECWELGGIVSLHKVDVLKVLKETHETFKNGKKWWRDVVVSFTLEELNIVGSNPCRE